MLVHDILIFVACDLHVFDFVINSPLNEELATRWCDKVLRDQKLRS